MITLTVLTFNDAPTERLSAAFDELGGSIGRADSNLLVLPDPERTISRVHAQVVFRNGGYAIVDRGSNAISVNDRALGNGQEAPIRDGDRLRIGGYAIGVLATVASAASAPGASGAFADGAPTSASASDPFADLGFSGLGFTGFGAAASGSPGAPAAANRPAPGSASSASPFAAPPSSSGEAGQGIPEDWDPFAADARAPADLGRSLGASSDASSSETGLQRNFGADFGPVSGQGGAFSAALVPGGMASTPAEDSLDRLFDLGGSTGGDPFARSPLAAPSAGPNTSGSADPMRAFGGASTSTPPAVADNASELNSPFHSPRQQAPSASPPPMQTPSQMPSQSPPQAPSTPQRPPPSQPPVGLPTMPGLPAGAVFSWEQPDDDQSTTRPMARNAAAAPADLASDDRPTSDADDADGRTVIHPARPVPALPGTPAPSATPATPASSASLQAAMPIASTASNASTTASTPPPTASSDSQALLAAFLAGLDAPSVRIDALTPELMRLVGGMLSESTRGAVELLLARAAVKREVRAQVTMIVARENNPLKFSPSAEAALKHLLGPATPGFMPPQTAVRDAFDDLRAHQLAFMAGMKAALDGVLQRFDPKHLESRLTQRSLLSSLLPASRKAQMWEVFQTLYAQISSEASDDFHELFGKAFLAAYEAQVEALSHSARPTKD